MNVEQTQAEIFSMLVAGLNRDICRQATRLGNWEVHFPWYKGHRGNGNLCIALTGDGLLQFKVRPALTDDGMMEISRDGTWENTKHSEYGHLPTLMRLVVGAPINPHSSFMPPRDVQDFVLRQRQPQPLAGADAFKWLQRNARNISGSNEVSE